MNENNFAGSAQFYDLDPRSIHSTDIDFFVQRASRSQGSMLELACGTGRITIPLAESGVNVWGLDFSEAMLSILRKKRAKLPEEIASRIHIHQADMSFFSCTERFEQIITPFRSFQALVTKEQQRSCLRCVREHLVDNGQLILDVFRPYGQLDKSWEAPPQLDWEVVDPVSGKKVRREHARRRIDVENQILDIDMIFLIEGEAEIIDPLRLTYFYPKQIESLLREAGFTVVESMGDYEGKPLDAGSELIYVCRKDR